MEKEKSFTLIELLVVIAIIGLLASLILVNISGTTNKARIAKTLEYSGQVYNALGSEAVGVWNFDEGSGLTAYDLSGYGNNGIIYNGAFYATDTPQAVAGAGTGKYSLYFDGVNDYVNCGRQSSLYSLENGDFTVEAWVYPTDHISVDGGRYTIVSFYNPGWMIDLIRDSGVESYRFYTGSASKNYSTGGLNLPLKWQHIVWTVDSSYFTFYLDGARKTKIAKSAITVSTGNLRIGRQSSAQPMKGYIDDVRIYSTALSAMEIQQHYAEGLEGHKDLVSNTCSN